ncbi:STAS domain-containing protein [Streptomyces anulatus]|uniref:STAS domain-containing protein n=1 Tax=Streptomyces anulatus TaxID=1892 RepID=UPI0033CB06C5
MAAATYRLDEHHQVIEVREVIDLAEQPAVEEELCRLITVCGLPAVIVDLRIPILTTTTLHLLVRLRQTADRHDVTLCVTARSPQAAQVLRLAGLHDFLRVTASLPGARAMVAACAPFSAGQSRARRHTVVPSRTRAQVNARLYALIRADFARPRPGRHCR